MKPVDKLLNERQKTHGEYAEQALTTIALRHVMQQMPNWNDMPAYMILALDMIAVKIARMGHGDWKHVDSAADISGYATLVVKELEKK